MVIPFFSLLETKCLKWSWLFSFSYTLHLIHQEILWTLPSDLFRIWSNHCRLSWSHPPHSPELLQNFLNAILFLLLFSCILLSTKRLEFSLKILTPITFLCACLQCVPSRFSWVWLFVTPWTVAHQAPLSMEFSRQGYWSGLPCPSPGDLPDSGIKLASLTSPALAGGLPSSFSR